MMKFNQKYNREDFIGFLSDFLPEDFQEKEKDIVLEKDKYKKITKVKEFGYCESLDLYVLEKGPAFKDKFSVLGLNPAMPKLRITNPGPGKVIVRGGPKK